MVILVRGGEGRGGREKGITKKGCCDWLGAAVLPLGKGGLKKIRNQKSVGLACKSQLVVRIT